MSNYHWVCFSCREAVRRHGSAENVRCPKCAEPCDNIGYKNPVPPKNKPHLWHELATAYAEARRNYFERRSTSNVRRLHALEQEVSRIQGLEPNAGRAALLKKLCSELSALQSQHAELISGKQYYLHGKLPPRRPTTAARGEA
jgi:hypothetical protein